MRTSLLHALLAATVIGIACTDDVTNPVVEWESVLSGGNEVPAVTTTGAGTASFTVSGTTLTYTVNITAPLSSVVTQSHIHQAAAGANGNIAIWLCHTSGGTGVPAGTPACAAGTAAGVLVTGTVAVTSAQITTMRAFGMYVNVHTANNTGGEVRGQLRNVVD
jgi:hypothetical protein